MKLTPLPTNLILLRLKKNCYLTFTHTLTRINPFLKNNQKNKSCYEKWMEIIMFLVASSQVVYLTRVRMK